MWGQTQGSLIGISWLQQGGIALQVEIVIAQLVVDHHQALGVVGKVVFQVIPIPPWTVCPSRK